MHKKAERLEEARLLERLRNQEDLFQMFIHDLRAPLTAVKSYTDLLLRYREETEEVQLQFLRTNSREIERMSCMVKDFLDLIKSDRGAFVCHRERIDMKCLVDYFVTVFEAGMTEKKIRIEKAYEEGLPTIFGDPLRLGQVMSNLISNALKFTPVEGNIRISLTAKDGSNQRFPGNGSGVVVIVEDNGPGIPAAERQRIFDKYYQVKSCSTGPRSGVGLGLPIAKQIVSHHGGQICVEAGTLGGSAFIVYLPYRGGRRNSADEGQTEAL
jgi:signal transduction histidine kinase